MEVSNPDVLLRLYVAGKLPGSKRALGNLTAFCQQHLPDCYRLEVIDVFEKPERALEDEVFITPALVVLKPLPVRTVVGNLSDVAALEHLFAAEIQDVESRRKQMAAP